MDEDIVMTHQGPMIIPNVKKPKLQCVTCKHVCGDDEDPNKYWCTQSPLEQMWHQTPKDGFCYFHTKWKGK